MDEGGLVYALCGLLGGSRGESHGEGGREVGRGDVEGGTGVADGDADELDASPISSEGAKEGVVLLGLLGELVVAPEVPAEADLEEDEGAVLAVEGVEVRSGVGWHSSGVYDVRGGSHSCRHQAVEVFLWEDPSRYIPRDRHAFFVVSRCIPLHGESLNVYEHINSAISVERGGRSWWC